MTEVDDPLLNGVRAGTPDWANIYATHREAMLRSAASVLFHSEDRIVHGLSAMDIVQNVVQRLRESELPRDIKNLRAYLITCTRHEALDVLRKTRFERKDAFGKEHIPWEVPLTTTYQESWVDAAADVEVMAERDILRESIMEKLPALLERDRYVLNERVIKGRPAKEVAADLKVTPQRVSQLVTGALKRLRDLIEQ